ncbi:MAG TPA: alpha/beta fold hydrolase, partial [Methylomirabilota bacterium]|nr:alpha/beta fold hydrolase [Methylomirabilota bacterium]
CVPGLGDLRQQYRFLAPRLESKGFRVITMDVRGHGASSVNWPDYSAAAVGADIVALIHHLGARNRYCRRKSPSPGTQMIIGPLPPESSKAISPS